MKGPWTFDLTNMGFVRFFQDRTGYMITEVPVGWPVVVKLINNPPDSTWRLTRAKVQDCWELFTQKVEAPKPVQPTLFAEDDLYAGSEPAGEP